jgi:hypothetical protein
MKPASFPLQEDKHAQLKQDAERRIDLYGAIDVIKETDLIKVVSRDFENIFKKLKGAGRFLSDRANCGYN